MKPRTERTQPGALLGVIVASLGAVGCAETENTPPRGLSASYPAGGVVTRQADVRMPELPCLPPDDDRLRVLGPGCMETFAVTAGPKTETDVEGRTICTYEIQYTHRAGCFVGRPLVHAQRAVVAALHRGVW